MRRSLAVEQERRCIDGDEWVTERGGHGLKGQCWDKWRVARARDNAVYIYRSNQDDSAESLRARNAFFTLSQSSYAFAFVRQLRINPFSTERRIVTNDTADALGNGSDQSVGIGDYVQIDPTDEDKDAYS